MKFYLLPHGCVQITDKEEQRKTKSLMLLPPNKLICLTYAKKSDFCSKSSLLRDPINYRTWNQTVKEHLLWSIN